MGVDYSFVLPCRNEEQSIGHCINQIKSVIKNNKLNAEIIVSDSSTDNSKIISKKLNIKVSDHEDVGYGIALIHGLKKAKGKYIVIGDADGSYNFLETPNLIKKITQGYDFVIGSRLKGRINKGSMPWHHRYIGNPLLSKILNLFFKTNVSDTHSGFRIIKKSVLKKLELKTKGMEFASEMIIKAAKNNIAIGEVPISYLKRTGKSKLNSFGDGWRHLRFMLMFSPTYLFFIPGFTLFIFGIMLNFMLLYGNFYLKETDITLFLSVFSSFLSILGFQLVNLGLYSRIYALHSGFEKQDKLIDHIAKMFPFERGILIGVILLFISIINVLLFQRIQNYLISLTIIVLGIQTIFSVFFISMMLVEKNEK